MSSEFAGESNRRNATARRGLYSIRLLVLGLALVLLAAESRGQAATVIGTIQHRTGKPAVNVLVWIAGNYRYTDVGGRYRISGVPLGRQRMVIRSGRRVLWQGDVNVAAGTTTINETIP
jgi:hypothetical protein